MNDVIRVYSMLKLPFIICALSSKYYDYPFSFAYAKHNKNNYPNGFFGMYPQTAFQSASMAMPMPMPTLPQSTQSPSKMSESLHSASGPSTGRIVNPPMPEYIKKKYAVTTNADYVCPDGFAFNNDQCARYDQLPSKVGCPEGWRYDKGICRGVESVAPKVICDEGYILQGEMCTKPILAPKQMLCPKGFELSLRGCVRSVHTSPELVCPFDYHVNGDHCIKPVEAVPILSCPNDYYLKDKKCVKDFEVEGIWLCKDSAVLRDNMCEIRHELPQETYCPIGFVLNGHRCTRTLKESILYECPDKYSLRLNDCVLKETVPLEMSCPIGFKPNSKGSCSLTQTVSAELTCSKGYTYDKNCGGCYKGKHGCEGHGKTASIFNSKELTKSRIKSKIISPITKCPENYVFSDKNTCIGDVVRVKRSSCPDGYTMDNEHCIKMLTVKANLVCRDGWSNIGGGICMLEKHCPIEKKCQPGMTMVDGICVHINIIPAEYHCPKRTTRKHSTLPTCISVAVITPELICPPTMLLSISKNAENLLAEICVGEETCKAEHHCPIGFELTSDEISITCSAIEDAPPMVVCPDSFMESDGDCMKYESSPRRVVCPDNTILTYGMCIEHLDRRPVVLCPIGYKLDNEVCVKEVKTDPIARCAKGYSYDQLTGECYRMETQWEIANQIPERLPIKRREALLDLPDAQPEPKKRGDAILSPEEPDEPEDRSQPNQVALAQAPQNPPRITVIQQPIPVPTPQVVLPQQAPAPPPPPRQVPVPVPVPIPQPVPYAVGVDRPVPVQYNTKQKPAKYRIKASRGRLGSVGNAASFRGGFGHAHGHH